MDRREALLALHLTGVIGPRRLRSVLDTFRDPADVFGCTEERLAALKDWTPSCARKVAAFREPRQAVERELERAGKAGVGVRVQGDPGFPGVFEGLYDPPFVLWMRGTYREEDRRSLAVVGCRRPSSYGQQVALRLSADLARAGYTVVSGLARGIDSSAHRGALSVPEGRTLAFLGSGFGQMYPPENAELASRISDHGAVFSEYPFDSKPLTLHFPQRNRLISGASLGVLVVEAEEDSGSLITVDHALDQGRTVFAVPGPIHQEQSRGTHALIREGARLVMSVDDVLKELGDPAAALTVRSRRTAVKTPGETDLTEEESRLMEHIAFVPVHVDGLVRDTGIPVRRLSELLLVLEMKGRVSQAPGHCYFRA